MIHGTWNKFWEGVDETCPWELGVRKETHTRKLQLREEDKVLFNAAGKKNMPGCQMRASSRTTKKTSKECMSEGERGISRQKIQLRHHLVAGALIHTLSVSQEKTITFPFSLLTASRGQKSLLLTV